MRRNLIHRRTVFKMIQSQPSIEVVITVEIKTDKNASEASDQDPTKGVSCITYNARDVAKS